MDIEDVWDDFLVSAEKKKRLIENKLGNHVLSEDTFRMEMGYRLSEALGSYRVFAEYPCHKSRSQRWDLCFIHDGLNCIEIKYMRPIPSGRNRPRTQHYGSILSDLFKLKLYSKEESHLYFILITDELFEGYLSRKNFPIHSKDLVKRKYDLEDIPKTAKNEIFKRLNGDIPDHIEVDLRLIDDGYIDDLSFYLFKILPES
ncbi:MAG: hypothetical protein R6W73_09195 [Candidatus Saliniplasma sp.]